MVIRRETPNCYHCNSTQHLAKDCKFKAAKCHHCGKVVCIQKACLSKAMAQGQVPKGKKSPHPLKAHLVNDNGCCDPTLSRTSAGEHKTSVGGHPHGAGHWSYCDKHQ